MRFVRSAVLAAACVSTGLLAQGLNAQAKVPLPVEYVRAGKMFDSHAGKYVDGAVLVVEGARIKSVESANFAIPAGATVVDLRGSYVFPGLIDCHVHLTGQVGHVCGDCCVPRDAGHGGH